MASNPTYTPSAPGNVRAAANLAANTPTVAVTVDVSANYEGVLQCGGTPAAAPSATNGLQVQLFPIVGTGVVSDSVAFGLTIPAVTSGVLAAQTFRLQTGKYSLVMKNLDGTVALNNVYATLDLISGP
jgi:hypothetical protein